MSTPEVDHGGGCSQHGWFLDSLQGRVRKFILVRVPHGLMTSSFSGPNVQGTNGALCSLLRSWDLVRDDR